MSKEINNFISAEEMIKYLMQFNTQNTGFKDRFRRVYIFKEAQFERHIHPYTGEPDIYKYTIDKVDNEFHFKTLPKSIGNDGEYTIRFVKEIADMAEMLDETWQLNLKPSIYLVFQPKNDPEASPTILQL